MTSLRYRPVDVAERPVVGLMSHPVYAVPAAASLDQALRGLLVAGLRHLVVVDEGGQLAGVLGDRQVAAAWARDPGGMLDTPVAAVVDPYPPTVSRTATLRTVARVMRDNQTDVVVVVEPGRVPVGVVTAGDVVAAVARPRPGSPTTVVATVAGVARTS